MAIRIGAIGLGRLGFQHAYNLRFAIPGVELVALCDANAEKLHATAREWGVERTYTDFDAMIGDSGRRVDNRAAVDPVRRRAHITRHERKSR